MKIQMPLTWTRDATGREITYRPIGCRGGWFNTITANPRENTTIYVVEQETEDAWVEQRAEPGADKEISGRGE